MNPRPRFAVGDRVDVNTNWDQLRGTVVEVGEELGSGRIIYAVQFDGHDPATPGWFREYRLLETEEEVQTMIDDEFLLACDACGTTGAANPDDWTFTEDGPVETVTCPGCTIAAWDGDRPVIIAQVRRVGIGDR